MLVATVGGLSQAAQIAGVDPDTINNWRKEGARVPVQRVLPLAIAAKVSMDWIATGHQLRPDIKETMLQQLQEPEALTAGGPGPGFLQLLPVESQQHEVGSSRVERWTPSEISVSAEWLQDRFGLSQGSVRYARLGDAGMAPLLGKEALVLVDIRPAALRSGIYLLGVGGEYLARRLQRLPDGTAQLVADAEPNWRFAVSEGGRAPVLLHRIVWGGQAL